MVALVFQGRLSPWAVDYFGIAEDVIEQLERRVDRLDCNLFVFRVGWPGMENYKQLKVIELMGEHVLPYFHKKYGRG
jgi:hypothetical protein